MIGYDIDGVLTHGIKPSGDYVIVSGRLHCEWAKTVAQLGVDAPIYLRPYGQCPFHHKVDQNDYDLMIELSGAWKALVVSMLGITEFYEDDPKQAEIIKERCPECIVHRVEGGKVSGTF